MYGERHESHSTNQSLSRRSPLMTKQPVTPRIPFVGFHDEAKNVDVLRDAEGRLSHDDSA